MDPLSYATEIHWQGGPAWQIWGTNQATNLLWQEGMPYMQKQASRSLLSTRWIWHGSVWFVYGQHQLLIWSWTWWWCWWNDNCCTWGATGKSVTQSLWRGIQGPDGRQLCHRRTGVPSNPPAPTTSGSWSSRRAMLYVHTNQDIKSCDVIWWQVIQNQCNHRTWDTNGGPSRPTLWSIICTHIPPHHNTDIN